jgi:hypothetical protein
MIDTPIFLDALNSLCEQMGLVKGTISEEGQMTNCPVHYTLSSENGFYAIQVIGMVVGTPDEITCYIMTVHTLPYLKTKSNSYVGKWGQKSQRWEFE